MERAIRRRYTLEYKQEAVRLVAFGQKVSGGGEVSWHRGADVGQLGEGGQARIVARREQRAAQRGANGEHSSACGAAPCDDGTRHTGKGHCLLREGAAMKCAWIERHKLRWPMCGRCQVLKMSASGYLQHLTRRKKILARRHLSQTALLRDSRGMCHQTGACGWPPSWRQLKASGVCVGERAMRQSGIQAPGKRCCRVITTDSNCALPIAPNLLAHSLTVLAGNTFCIGVITFASTNDGWLYVAVVLDLFSRRIVGSDVGEATTAELACRALNMAWQQSLPGEGLIFHRERGNQYASGRYAELVSGHGINASMSRKGNYWDNAYAETLLSPLSVERLDGMAFKDRREAKNVALNWMPWYNRSRLHSVLGYLGPLSSSSKQTLSKSTSQFGRERVKRN